MKNMPTLLPTSDSESHSPTGKKGSPTGKKNRPGKKNGPVKKPKYKKDTKFLRVVEKDTDVHDDRLNLDLLRKSLPAEVWEISTRRSLQWMVWDIAVWATCLYLQKLIYHDELAMVNSVIGSSSSDITSGFFFRILCKFVLIGALAVLGGFFMWATWCVGHDCMHGTFSKNWHVNFICGLINHGSVLVPFTPWARAHQFHHQCHGHAEKDWHYAWCHDPKYDSAVANSMATHKFTFAALFPSLVHWWYMTMPVMLAGTDGSMYFPGVFPGDRLWEGVDRKELTRAWISVLTCYSFLYFYITVIYASSFVEFLVLFVPTIMMGHYFLVSVTYLQHHDPDALIFDDTTWKFGTANFETIDRSCGRILDVTMHHMSDCHVVHHLFFNKIPHYNLEPATKAMVKWMEENGVKDLYKFDVCHDFLWRCHKYLYTHYMRGKLVTTKDL